MVPGHEIAGVVSAVGAKVSKFEVGDRIGVGVFVDSCRVCASCQMGLQQYCVEGMTGTYNGLERDGVTVAMGGYSNNFVINEDYAVHAGTLLNGRRSLSGSMIGGIPEMQEMLDFCAEHQIVSDVEVIKADYINEAYKRTVASDVKYRFVIDASTF